MIVRVQRVNPFAAFCDTNQGDSILRRKHIANMQTTVFDGVDGLIMLADTIHCLTLLKY